jgi:hypothetical protein
MAKIWQFIHHSSNYVVMSRRFQLSCPFISIRKRAGSVRKQIVDEVQPFTDTFGGPDNVLGIIVARKYDVLGDIQNCLSVCIRKWNSVFGV